MNKWSFSIAYFLCAIVTAFLFHSWIAPEHGELIAYSDFKRLAHDGKVLNAVIGDRTITVEVDMQGIELSTSSQNGFKRTYRGPGHRTFATFRIGDPGLIATLQGEGVRFSAARSGTWFDTALSWLLPAVALLAIWYFAIRWMKPKSR